ncbi:Epithelial sodium channel [Cinara cedri]|uniref:Epithelial sodium channel n=1 Tax=Cinara cedri TaxID=506608 RepID=A0A5E4NN14_9HEMI|nr:Epithelial sodium channel [Cinara cedri]
MSKTKSPKTRSVLPKNYLREFSSITSLHGIMYLGEPNRPLFERMAFLNHTHSENILQKNESVWTPENRYSINATPFDLPWRVTGDTIENAVRLVFNLKNTNLGGHCPETDSGLTIIVHNPADTPIGMKPTAYVTRNNMLSISLSIVVIHTSPKITNWTPKNRNCYFQNEKKLKFFKIYTSHNCEVECRANNTLEECGCNAYFQPRDPNVLVCGSNSTDCVRESMTIGYSIFDKQLKKLNNMDGCECLPACMDIRYDYETVEFFRNWTTNSTSLKINEDKSMVMAYYRRKLAVSIQKSPLMPFSELLGNIGGLFGLFLGCSIVSFFEIIYFFVIRLYFNQRDRRMAKSKIMPNIILDE